jgi:hypothetical protein
MFAVPEVDDDTAVTSSLETTQPSIQSEITTETLPSPPPSIPTAEKEEKVPDTTQTPPASASKQHLSRLSLFHRNTIHVCDQIADRV